MGSRSQLQNTAQLRRLLNQTFDDPSLDAFCQDYFSTVYDRFGRGMRRDEKITLLLDHCRRTSDGFDKLLSALQVQFQEDETTLSEIAALTQQMDSGQRGCLNPTVRHDASFSETITPVQPKPEQIVPENPTAIPLPQSSSLRQKLVNILRDPVWQGIGGLVAILALGWGIYTFYFSAGNDAGTPIPTYTVTASASVSSITVTPTGVPAQTSISTEVSANDMPTQSTPSTPTPHTEGQRITLPLPPTETPVPRYPPPSPALGIPPGPLQAEMNAEGPSVCDAAEYLGPFVGDYTKRILIGEDDNIAIKTIAGSTIYRAWRLRNIGTCAWGPGYELAFYGGQKMGSDGVTFESLADDTIANSLEASEHLIIPEGNPNQVAVLEVKLQAPNTPGIVQSYWRMRNPEGEYFGPIVGITMDVIRECQYGVYGVPVINRFEILSVGELYGPSNPIESSVALGESITLGWDVINVSKFKVVVENPQGKRETINTQELGVNDKLTFSVEMVGKYTVTLYTYNGSCTITTEVVLNSQPK